MIENLHGRNYELAKAEADKVDEQIIEVLQKGYQRILSSFRLQYIPLRGMQLSNIRVF